VSVPNTDELYVMHMHLLSPESLPGTLPSSTVDTWRLGLEPHRPRRRDI
jgi:hypothetical protein